MNKENSHTKITIGAILLSIFYVFSQYSLPIMSYGMVGLFAFCVIYFLFHGELVINKSLLFFCMICAVQQAVVYAVTGTFKENVNTYLFIYISAFLLSITSQIQEDSFYKCYKIVAVIFSAFVIYQALVTYVFGQPVSAIRILPVSADDLHFWSREADRPSGLFTEPQAFASFLHPLLITSLFKKEKKFAIFLTIAIFASASSQGIIVAALIWAYYLLIIESQATKKFLSIAIFLMLTFIGIESGLFNVAIEKLSGIHLGSYDIRLTKGFMIYGAMPLKDKIMGIGEGNLRTYLLSGGFDFFWMGLTRDELFAYVTSMANVCISYGIVGFYGYIRIFVKEYLHTKNSTKLMIIVLLVVSFAQTLIFNMWFIFYWSIYQVMDQEKTGDRYFILRIRKR